jgi:selenocysteine-specific elongation factor
VPDDTPRNVILGTAGHIDHGKSSLVKALTGTDPDRLKEEKERGITIDLGFASLSYPEGLTVGIVDVPGHERLIRNMLAGAGGIDMLLMVIAADEGVMPQTREHLAICRLLRIRSGIVAITKADLVDPEWLQLVTEDVKGFLKGTFLEDAEIIPVSSKTGLNTDLMKERIRELALRVEPRLKKGIFRMPIDRVFTLKGFGTVVTGTAVSGTIALDSPMEILPSGLKTKVRGLQCHGKAVTGAFAGQRIGVNLQGIDKDQVQRGDVLVPPGSIVPTRVVEAVLQLMDDSPPVKTRGVIHFYSGAAETLARVILYDREQLEPGESSPCRLRLQDPVILLSGDRFVVRRLSPLQTMGGGEVLDPHPGRRRRKDGIEDLRAFENGGLKERIEAKARSSALRGVSLRDIEGWIQGEIPDIISAIEELIKEGLLIRAQSPAGEVFIHREVFTSFRDSLAGFLAQYHKANPLRPGMPKEELRQRIKGGESLFNSLIPLIGDLVVEKDVVRLRGFSPAAASVSEERRELIIAAIERNGLQPPFKEDLIAALSLKERELTDILRLLTTEGALVRINDSLFMSKGQNEKLILLLRDFFSKKKEMTVAEFRDLLSTTRKYALPLLEYLDSHRITIRVGDIRKFMLK